MRLGILAWLLLLAAPSAAAASQVHVTFLGDSYAVMFESEEAEPVVMVGGTSVRAEPMPETGGDDDRFFVARLPSTGGPYEVEGRAFALRPAPALDAATRIVFVSDIGTTSDSRRILARILNESPDLVLIGGDLSYAHGIASRWDSWFAMMEPLAANVPVMPAFGNHEDYCEDERGSLRACGPSPNEWHDHFLLPHGEHLYYGFDWGPVRVTALDTEAYVHDSGKHPTQRDEQERFLATSLANASERWDIVMFHRALRTTSTRENAENPTAREALEPALEKGADLVLAGHLHAYERGRQSAEGPTYVTSGGGGISLYDQWGPEEDWLEKRATEFHFVVFDVTPGRIEGRAISIDGAEIDRFAWEREVPASLRPTPTPSPAATPTATPTAVTPERVDATPAPASPRGPPGEARATPVPVAAIVAGVALAAAGRRLLML